MLDQEMPAQVFSKRENLGKSAEIFTIQFADEQPGYAGNLQLDCETNIVWCGADGNQMDIDGCGSDLFFELWDFSDSPVELELA